MLFIYFVLYIFVGILALELEYRLCRHSAWGTIQIINRGSMSRMLSMLGLQLLIWPTWGYGLSVISLLFWGKDKDLS